MLHDFEELRIEVFPAKLRSSEQFVYFIIGPLGSTVGGALNIGVTPIEIKESLYQCAPFIGFPRVQEAIKIVNDVMLSRGISLPLDRQRRIEEGDRFEKGREIQFPIYGDRIKQTVSNLPEEQRESIPRYLTELCFGDFYTRAGLDLQTRELSDGRNWTGSK